MKRLTFASLLAVVSCFGTGVFAEPTGLTMKGLVVGMALTDATAAVKKAGFFPMRIADVYESTEVDLTKVNMFAISVDDDSCRKRLLTGDKTNLCKVVGQVSFNTANIVTGYTLERGVFNADNMAMETFARSIVESYDIPRLKDISTSLACTTYEGEAKTSEVVDVSNCPGLMTSDAFVTVRRAGGSGSASFN